MPGRLAVMTRNSTARGAGSGDSPRPGLTGARRCQPTPSRDHQWVSRPQPHEIAVPGGSGGRDGCREAVWPISFSQATRYLLSALSVLENVAIVAELAGLKGPAAREKATAILTEIGLRARLDFLPEKLSGGEKQRVAIARALINSPTLIMADEPTANLDSKIGYEIMRLLRRIAKEQGRSVVIDSHDQRIHEIADRVLWLEDGGFKDIVTMATDPVCGMAVEREWAVNSERDGETHYFYSRGCREEFLGSLRADAPSADHGRLSASSEFLGDERAGRDVGDGRDLGAMADRARVAHDGRDRMDPSP